MPNDHAEQAAEALVEAVQTWMFEYIIDNRLAAECLLGVADLLARRADDE